MVPAVARILRLPVVPLLGLADNTLPVVYAGNVAAALVLALKAARGGETFDIGLDHPLTQRDLLERLARGVGIAPRFLSVPLRLVRVAAELLSRSRIKTPGAKHVSLSRVARLALGENPYRSVRIRRELGWDPPHQHSDALVRSGRWFERHC